MSYTRHWKMRDPLWSRRWGEWRADDDAIARDARKRKDYSAICARWRCAMFDDAKEAICCAIATIRLLFPRLSKHNHLLMSLFHLICPYYFATYMLLFRLFKTPPINQQHQSTIKNKIKTTTTPNQSFAMLSACCLFHYFQQQLRFFILPLLSVVIFRLFNKNSFCLPVMSYAVCGYMLVCYSLVVFSICCLLCFVCHCLRIIISSVTLFCFVLCSIE